MPRRNPQTMTRSLLLSRWKQVVWTFSSVASRQKSIPLERQKAFVHCEQDEEAARLASWWRSGDGRSRGEDSDWSSECWGPRATIVLFLKQVHLQNVGAAVEDVSSWSIREKLGSSPDVQFALTRATKPQRIRSMSDNRLILTGLECRITRLERSVEVKLSRLEDEVDASCELAHQPHTPPRKQCPGRLPIVAEASAR